MRVSPPSAPTKTKEVSLVEGVRQALGLERRPLLEIPAGTSMKIRLKHGVSSASYRSGDSFRARLASPLKVGGRIAAPAGSEVVGILPEVDDFNRVEGRARLTIELTELIAGADGYPLSNNVLQFRAEGPSRETLR